MHVMSQPADDFLGFRHDVDRAARGIDDRCAGDADFRLDVARVDVAVGDGGNACSRIEKVYLPERRGVSSAGVVRVERVNTRVLGADEYNIMHALSGNGDAGQDQWLAVDIPIDWIGEQASEGIGIYVCVREVGFKSVQTQARIVIMVGQNGNRIGRRRIREERDKGKGGTGPGCPTGIYRARSEIIGSVRSEER